jgi:prophage DNA circulation protein
VSYRDSLRPASFKGFPFWVDESSLTGGLRAEIHQYAERNDHFVEPLGGMALQFPVTAHLLGDDVIEQRRRFLELLRAVSVPGTLVLPLDGELEVYCLRFRIRDSITREGRITRLGLTFVESGKNQFPDPTIDTGQVVLDQGDAGIVVLTETFSEQFTMSELLPTFVLDAAAALSGTIVEGMDEAIRRTAVGTDARDDLLRHNAALQSDLRLTIGTPSTLASELTGIYRSLGDLGADARATLGELETLGGILDSTPAVPTGTASRTVEAENQIALQDLNRRTAAVEMARAATRTTLVSSVDATAVRDQVDVALDAEIMAAGDAGADDVFRTLRDLRAKVVQDLDTRGARLPAIRTFRVPATLPALVIASRLYDDPTRDAEIVARNEIRAPGFVLAHTDLEVLAE